MTRAAFALWAGAVLLVYYRRAWWLLAAGAFREWTLADARATVLPLALLVIVAAGTVGWTLDGTARRRTIALIVLAAVLAAGVAAATGPMFWPFAGEAVARGAAAVAGAALVAFVAWTLGTALWATLTGLAAPSWPGSGATRFALAETFLFQVAVGFGALAAVSGVLALAGWYTPPAVLGVLALGAVVGFGRIWMRRGRFGTEWRERGTDFGPGWKPRGVVDRAWFGVTILALAVALAGALAPETEYDALWYHLWLPRQWLLRGTAFDTFHEYVALYPLTWELVFGAGLAAGGPGAAKLLHFCCLPLLALTAWQATRRFFPAASPWLAAAVTVTVPTVLWEATTAYIDLALALYVSLALYALMAWRDDRAPACFWLAAICLGLGAAVKHLGLMAVVLAAVALTLAPLDDDPIMRRATRRNWGRDWISWRRLLPPAALIATALLIAAPWYLRAWLGSRNPIFPELFEVFGATPALRWDAVTERGLDGFKARFGVPRAPLPLALLPWTMTMNGARFGGSLGPVFLLLLPAMARAAWRDRRACWLAVFAVGYVAFWASPWSSFQLRFLVPVVVPLSVLASCGTALVSSSLPAGWRPLALAGLGLVLVSNLPPFMALHEGDRDRTGWLTHVAREIPLRVVTGRQAEEDYLRERVPSYGAWQHLRTAVPAAARVLVAGSRHNFYATRELLSIDAPAARLAWSEDPSRTAAALPALRITHILVERAWLRSLRPPLPALASEAFRRERLTPLYSDSQALVYEVPRLEAEGHPLRQRTLTPVAR